jgi:hypothetical protein
MSGPANSDASIMFSEQPVDFLGFAAQSGLILYVQEVVGSHPEWLDSPTATYPLRCVIDFMIGRNLNLEEKDHRYAHIPELVATLVGPSGKAKYVNVFQDNLDHFSRRDVLHHV